MELCAIVPSKTSANVFPSVGSIALCDPSVWRVVVDDGLEQKPPRTLIVPGAKPFIFARAINMGLRAAMQNWPMVRGFFLTNDDAILRTDNGFTAIAELAEQNPQFGIIAPCTNVTGSREQTPHGLGLREVSHIAFVCVYVPRGTIESVGLLDERFTTYGWEDNDYCHRVKQAGLKIGVYDQCFVDHGSLKSTFRGSAMAAGDIEPGRKIFHAKWGFA